MLVKLATTMAVVLYSLLLRNLIALSLRHNSFDRLASVTIPVHLIRRRVWWRWLVGWPLKCLTSWRCNRPSPKLDQSRSVSMPMQLSSWLRCLLYLHLHVELVQFCSHHIGLPFLLCNQIMFLLILAILSLQISVTYSSGFKVEIINPYLIFSSAVFKIKVTLAPKM